MPERWQRELRKLRDVEPREHPIRERAAQGPSGHRPPSRREPLIAGVVAGAVAIAGVAFLWQLSPDGGTRETGGAGGDLPTLIVTFASNGTIGDTPSDADPIRRVDTTISYGDALEEAFTSTTPTGAHVDYVGVEQVTRFVPGPTAGSPVRIVADGGNPRVLIGRPADWAEFERFTPVEVLPSEPGEYVLLFEADYPEGTARTARYVEVIPSGVLQLVTGHADDPGARAATAYLDGRGVDGFLHTGFFYASDSSEGLEQQPQDFEATSWLQVPTGTPVVLAQPAIAANAGLFPSTAAFEVGAPLPIDLLNLDRSIDGPFGRHVLVLDVVWDATAPESGGVENQRNRALYLFPIEIVREPQEGVGLPDEGVSPTPSPIPSPSSDASVTGGIVVSVFGVGERSNDTPIATFSHAGETKPACTQDFEWTRDDGTQFGMTLDPGGADGAPGCAGRAIGVPPGTPIAIEATTTTSVSTTRATTQFFEGDVGLVVSALWPQGEATFVVPVTVAFEDPDLELVVLDCRPEEQVPITGPDTRIEPAGSAYIIGNLPGFEQGDVVEQMTREDRSDAGDLAGVWQVVRDGTVVASVNYPELSGTACEGSGIGEP